MAGEHDPFDTVGQEAAEANDAEATRLRRDREVDDFLWVMGSQQGRRFMWRLLAMTGVFRNPHIPGTDDVLFRCGMMNVGQQLMSEIHTLCPQQYTRMSKEQQEWLKKQAAQ